jgi:hypothetical protein
MLQSIFEKVVHNSATAKLKTAILSTETGAVTHTEPKSENGARTWRVVFFAG